MNARTVAFVSALAVAVPLTAAAQAVPRQGVQSPAYRTGYDRGVYAGQEDGRRNDRFEYTDESDYRSADRGYSRNYGDRDRYRAEFRQGFENGYREGYGRYQNGSGNYGNYGRNGGYNDGTWRPGAGGPPPWAQGRGRGAGSWQRNDLAYQNGFTDGYDEGLKAGRDRQRFDPVNEGRYRSADHGYRSQYGSKDAYKATYRTAFREGYEAGFNDSRQYDSRNGGYYDPRYNDPRNSSGQSRPWWWPW